METGLKDLKIPNVLKNIPTVIAENTFVIALKLINDDTKVSINTVKLKAPLCPAYEIAYASGATNTSVKISHNTIITIRLTLFSLITLAIFITTPL